MHMSITLNSQIHGSTTTDNACGCPMLCNQIQGEHILVLRTDIKILSYFSNSWGYFQLNSGKCKELRINFTKDPCRDEPVKVNDKHFEVVTSAKILGMTITDDLKWNVHVANILLKASKRLYLLKQLKRANVDTNSLNKFYCACIRSVLEYACQAFHSGLPNYLSKEIKFRKEP